MTMSAPSLSAGGRIGDPSRFVAGHRRLRRWPFSARLNSTGNVGRPKARNSLMSMMMEVRRWWRS